VTLDPAALVNVTAVLLEMSNCPIVCVGTEVGVAEPPALNCSTSVAAGVVRVGDQFVETAQDAPALPIQV
jgi:hypothetical protein